jgi:D-arabinose 1-dehydrogenase-like Zn-dependent alcohol dehydrogenase
MSTTTTLKSPNIAVTTNPAHELSIVEVPTPSPAAGECLVHVTATGICGSDVHFWKHGGIGSSKVTCELGLGHESAGEIVGLGEGVEGWKIGEFWISLTHFHLLWLENVCTRIRWFVQEHCSTDAFLAQRDQKELSILYYTYCTMIPFLPNTNN